MRDFYFVKTDQPTMAEFNKRFGSIADFINNVGNEYVWERILKIPVVTLGTLTANVAYGSAISLTSFTFYCSDELGNDGLLKNPQTVTVLYNSPASTASVLKGKFWSRYTDSLTSIYYTPSDAQDAYIGTWTVGSTKYNHSLFIYSQTVTVAFNVTKSYVNSSNPNAYPMDDGYIYTALGQLGNKVQIATGKYTCTNTYGSSNPCILTFDFPPKIIMLLDYLVSRDGTFFDRNNYIANGGIIYADELTTEYVLCPFGPFTSGMDINTCNYVKKSGDGKTVYWYNPNGADKQFNYAASGSGFTWTGNFRRYLAIG